MLHASAVLTPRQRLRPARLVVEEGRPAMLYRFVTSGLEATDPFAVLKPPAAR